MKETENVFIETQAAKSAKENKVLLSGGDRDSGLSAWTFVLQIPILSFKVLTAPNRIRCRRQDRAPVGETGPKDEYFGEL